MSSTSILTVLIPTYRRAELLKVCLQSIVDSGMDMLEVIIGDDGGDEPTQNVCKDFAEILPINYLAPRQYPFKGSLSSNITRLLKAANGQWILLLHDDDFLLGDHSTFPGEFADECDFYFTDHLNVDKNGKFDEEKSLWASKKYGRTNLNEGIQYNVFDLAINERVCLDGFYVKTTVVQKILPDESLGPVADFFWMFNLLNSGVKVGYSSKKTFAYRTTDQGLTASGIDFDALIKGYIKLKAKFPDQNAIINNKISYYTWYAVNKSLRQSKKSKALKYLSAIKFRYIHSTKAQVLLLVQLFLLLLPASIANKLHK